MLTTEVAKVENLRDPARPWVLRWKTENMAAPAFWYFDTEEGARREEQNLRTQRRHQRDLR